MRSVIKRGKSAVLRDDRLQVLLNDGFNIGSNKRYRYVACDFELIDDLSSVCVESRGLWRNFWEKLGNSTGAKKATIRNEFTKENYFIRSSMLHIKSRRILKIILKTVCEIILWEIAIGKLSRKTIECI